MRIYLAWPTNRLADALAGAEQVMQAGHVPVLQGCAPEWGRADRQRIEACACVVRYPGESAKSDYAVDFAKVRGLPVYWSLRDCLADLPVQQGASR